VEAVWTIVEARLEELLGLAGAQLESYLESSQLGAGIVLTGGGALASGTVEVAEGVLERPVRLAAPTAFPGIGEAVADPRYSTAVGLALMAADDDGLTVPSDTSEGRFERLSERMKHWMSTLL
jgi:cell division protein FtsA